MHSNFPKIPLFASAIFFIFCCTFFWYINREIKNKNEEALAKETVWQTEASRRDEIKALDYSVKIIEPERAELETHFAKSSDIVPFLDTIDKGLAPKAGIAAEVVSVKILEDHTGLLVSLKASGSFEGIYKFITLLENSDYELDFVSMDVQRALEDVSASKTIKSAKWDALFTLKLISFNE